MPTEHEIKPITILNEHEALKSDRFETYLKVLIITLWKGGYAHEIITCIFNKCFNREIVEKDSSGNLKYSRQLIWPPRRIVAELSEIPLLKLCDRLENSYCEISHLPEDLISACFRLIYFKMALTVEESIRPNDQKAQKRWNVILDKYVGETTLSDYYGENPVANVTVWCHRVTTTVQKVLTDESWLDNPMEDLLAQIQTYYK